MNASTSASLSAEARMDWRWRNSERVMAGTLRSEMCGFRVFQAHFSRVEGVDTGAEVRYLVAWEMQRRDMRMMRTSSSRFLSDRLLGFESSPFGILSEINSGSDSFSLVEENIVRRWLLEQKSVSLGTTSAYRCKCRR